MSKKSRNKAARRAARKAGALAFDSGNSGSGSPESPGSPGENTPLSGKSSMSGEEPIEGQGVLGGGTGDSEHSRGEAPGGLETSTCYAVPIVEGNTVKEKLSAAKALHLKKQQQKQLEEKSKQENQIPIIALPPPPPLPKSGFTKKESKQSGKFFQNVQSTSASNFRDNKPLGLENLGNTCFMNAALQCLSRTKLLIPKLELFGSGEKISILVSPTKDESKIKISVQNNKKTIGNGHVGGGDGDKIEADLPAVNELEICEDEETSQKDWRKTPFLISLDISSESMTARLKHTFKAITRQTDSESYNSREFNSKQGGWYYGFKPHDVHNMIAKNFRPGAQHDSHELLRTIVDMMKKDQTKAFRAAIMKKFGVAKGGEGSDPKMVELVKSLDQKTKHQTFVDEIFGGELVTVQTCLTCNSSRRSHEEFLDLSLPIRVSKGTKESQKPNNKNKNSSPILSSSFYENENIVINRTVEQCLSSFIEPELLTGSNVVECESCHRINLAKLENGAAYEDVFPSAATTTPAKSSASTSATSTSKSNSNAENSTGGKKDKKKKRPSRQTRLKNQSQSQISREEREELQELLETKDSELPDYADAAAAGASGGSSASISIIENHFPVPPTKEPSEGEGSSKGTLEDYVVVSDTEITAMGPGAGEPKLDFMQEYDCDECDDMPPLISVDDEPGQGIRSCSPQLTVTSDLLLETESQESGTTMLNEEDADIDANSDDLPSSTDGVWGNVSDVDDGDEEGNGVPRLDLDLDLPTYDKFNFFNVPVPLGSSPDPLVPSPPVEEEPQAQIPMTSTSDMEMEVEKAAADEGYSEGGNSQDSESVRAEAGSTTDAEAVAAAAAAAAAAGVTKPLEPLSRGSSSRNSISDPEESSNSNSNSKDEDETLAASKTPVVIKKEPPVTKCPCTRQQAISRPPEFLTIHLKRFQISNRGYTSKLSEHIEFPFLLNLTPYCSVVPDEGTDDIFDEDGEVAYSLYGIVEHSGNLHWGHYVAYIKVPEDKSGEKEAAWYYISDSHVSSVTEASISDKDPYILFYERVRGDVKRARRESLKEKKNFKYGGFQNGLDSTIDTWSASTVGADSGWGGNWEEDQPVQEVVEGPMTEAEAEAEADVDIQGQGLLDLAAEAEGNYENEMTMTCEDGPMAPLIPRLPFVDDESQNWNPEMESTDAKAKTTEAAEPSSTMGMGTLL